jgi:hypothetical protein
MVLTAATQEEQLAELLQIVTSNGVQNILVTGAHLVRKYESIKTLEL